MIWPTVAISSYKKDNYEKIKLFKDRGYHKNMESIGLSYSWRATWIGKSGFLISAAINCTKENTIVLFSLEMHEAQLKRRFMKSDEDIESLPIFVDDTPSISTSYLRSKIELFQKEELDVQIVLIDYLNLMNANSRQIEVSRKEDLNEIVKSLKLIAVELNVIIVAVAQLPRALECIENQHPLLSDFWASDCIAKYADSVFSIHRESYYRYGFNDEEDDVVEIIVAKHHDNSLNGIKLLFDKPNGVIV